MAGSRSNKQSQAPSIDFTAPRVVDADASLLRARDDRDGERFSNADLSGTDLTGSSFIECEFASVTLTDAELRGARFVESLLSASFAPALKAARTTWRDVLIENPRWGSAELLEAEFDTVRIRGGKIDYLNLRNTRLNNVVIEECTITDLDLGGAKASRVALVNCRIETLDIAHASCVNVDLRTSDFSVVNGLEGLAGTTIDSAQLAMFAPLFAAHLGVNVTG